MRNMLKTHPWVMCCFLSFVFPILQPFFPSVKGELLQSWSVATRKSSCTSREIIWQEKGAKRGRFTFWLDISLIYGWWLQLQVKTIWCHQREGAVTRPCSSLECLGKIPCALQRCGSTTPNFSSVAAVRIREKTQEQLLSQTATLSLEFLRDT